MWTFCAGCDIIIKIQIYMLKSGTPNTIGTSNKVNEVCYMTVSYKKLWKLLIDRDLKKKDLEEMAGVSHYVMNKLTHGDNVTTDVLCKVCKALNCTVDEMCIRDRLHVVGKQHIRGDVLVLLAHNRRDKALAGVQQQLLGAALVSLCGKSCGNPRLPAFAVGVRVIQHHVVIVVFYLQVSCYHKLYLLCG